LLLWLLCLRLLELKEHLRRVALQRVVKADSAGLDCADAVISREALKIAEVLSTVVTEQVVEI